MSDAVASASAQPAGKTITEALAELKTISNRLDRKYSSILQYLYRPDKLKDPLEGSGGSETFVQTEQQAIHDLHERQVAIRRAIAAANSGTYLQVGKQKRSIADWLVWRKEVAPKLSISLARMGRTLTEARNPVRRATDNDKDDIVVNIDEKDLALASESLEETLGTLDGLLSLKNATVIINI